MNDTFDRTSTEELCMNVEIIKLSPADIDDFRSLLTVFGEVFEWKQLSLPAGAYLQRLISNETFIVFVAKVDRQTVGGLTAYVLDSYTAGKPVAYIYDVAVLENFQRQRIGKSLITALNDYCRNNGFYEAFVQAESEDSHALDFYRKTPITSELRAIHFTYSFDDGVDNR